MISTVGTAIILSIFTRGIDFDYWFMKKYGICLTKVFDFCSGTDARIMRKLKMTCHKCISADVDSKQII